MLVYETIKLYLFDTLQRIKLCISVEIEHIDYSIWES